MSKRAISYKWVLLGAGIIVGLNLVMRALLADPAPTIIMTSFPGLTGILFIIALTAFVSFFFGGALIGFFSPGETIREPAIAAVIAAGLNVVENFRNVDGKNLTVAGWFIGSLLSLGIGFMMALAGAWLGEKLQGTTPQKRREEIEPPRPSQDEA